MYLKVPVEHICRMYIFQPAQDLVHEVLYVVDREGLLAVDDSVQVSLHQVLHDVYVLKLLGGRRRRDNINNSNNLMGKALMNFSFKTS